MTSGNDRYGREPVSRSAPTDVPFLARSGKTHLDTIYLEAVTGNKILSYCLHRLEADSGDLTQPDVHCRLAAIKALPGMAAS